MCKYIEFQTYCDLYMKVSGLSIKAFSYFKTETVSCHKIGRALAQQRIFKTITNQKEIKISFCKIT